MKRDVMGVNYITIITVFALGGLLTFPGSCNNRYYQNSCSILEYGNENAYTILLHNSNTSVALKIDVTGCKLPSDYQRIISIAGNLSSILEYGNGNASTIILGIRIAQIASRGGMT